MLYRRRDYDSMEDKAHEGMLFAIIRFATRRGKVAVEQMTADGELKVWFEKEVKEEPSDDIEDEEIFYFPPN